MTVYLSKLNLFSSHLTKNKSPLQQFCRSLYEQGQSPKRGIREYFYYVDHQGQLFLDDARIKNFTSCFKEKDFLMFFYKRVKVNDTGRYESEFPFVSPCGREKNYIRCDDVPFVFTNVIESGDGNSDVLTYGYVGDKLSVPFEPHKICMLPESGRVYHPAPDKVGGVGLIKSALAIELSQYFGYGNGDDSDELSPPTTFEWRGTTYKLENELFKKIQSR